MTGPLGRAALALGLAQLIGCAQGYDSSLDQDPPIAGGSVAGSSAGAGRGGATGQAGGAAAGTGSGAAGMMFMGEPCERGETEECTCTGNQGQGIRTCRKDDLSPTMGSFSECEACVPDEEPAGMGGNGGSGSGAAGRGGAGGMAGTGRAGSGSGSAGSGSGSAGRTGGSGNNDPGWCLFVPIPLPGVCD